MAKRDTKAIDTDDLDDIAIKKRKLNHNDMNNSAHLHNFVQQIINNSTTDFVQKYTSNNLALIINDYISLNNNTNYPFIYISSQNKWKRKNKLKKSDRVQYLIEQIVHPLQYLSQQFNTNQLNKSLHYQYFLNGKSTSQTKWSKHYKFWVSSDISKPRKPLYWSENNAFISRSFNSICHFIQKESGTGVHIGNGYILSCAHVIAIDTDDENNNSEINRIGRIKYVIFANGLIYKAKCIAFDETYDVSLLKIDFNCVINTIKNNQIIIGNAVLSETEPLIKSDLFCVGNPSNVNLESKNKKCNNFNPKIFHLSFGKLEMEMKDSEINNDSLGGYGHSCFTYWGHSGAPLFNNKGEIVGLHNSWNDETGLRHAVKLKHIKNFVSVNCDFKIK